MGLFGTQWIQDMLDVSCGFGSWQLSMNQGLAHMQTMSFMNSCFSPSGFGFMPYTQLNSMNYLLNPNFASWQAMTGNNSNSASIFGNWGGMAGGMTGGAALNPWGNVWTNPSAGNSGTTGSKAKAKADDPGNKKIADKLKQLIKDYGTFVKTWSAAGNNEQYGEDLQNEAEEIYKNAESWEKAVEELENKYNEIINNSSNKKAFRAFILEKSGKESALKASGYDVLSKDNAELKRIADDINNELNILSTDNKNGDSLDSADSSVILGVLSVSNSDIITKLMNKYAGLSNTKKETVGSHIIRLINSLTDRANAVSAKLVDTTDIDNAIAELENYKIHPSDDINGFNTAFYKLYAITRIAEVKVLESEIDAKYNEYGDNLSEALGSYSSETITDLKSEFSNRNISINVDTLASNIMVKPVEVLDNVTGRGGSRSNNPSPEQLAKKRENVKATMTINRFTSVGNYNGKANETGITEGASYELFEITLTNNTKHQYIINNNGNLQEIQGGNIFGSEKSYIDVKNEIAQLEKDAAQAKLDRLNNPIKSSTLTVINGKQIGKSSTSWHDYSEKFAKNLDTALADLKTWTADSGYTEPEWKNAYDTLVEYYKAVYESLKEINWNELYDDRANGSDHGVCNNTELRKNCRYGKKCLSDDDKDSVVYRIAKEKNDVNTYSATTKDNAKSGSGLYVGCDYDSTSKNNFYFYLDPTTVFEKFKSFLPS